MINKRGWIALVASPICLAAVLLTSADSAHSANTGGPVDPTCTSSSPCIEYDNNSTGQGMKGFSHQGNGVTGWTGWNSTSTANSKYGVVGNDQSVSGSFDGGVLGKSTRGTGVSGISTSGAGISGASTSGTAILASTTGYGDPFYAAGVTNPAFIVDTLGDTYTYGIAIMNNGANIENTADTSGPTFGLRATVTGTDPSGAAILSETDNPESWIMLGYSLFHKAFTFEVTDDGTVFAKTFSASLAAKTLQKTSTGRAVDTYAHQVSQPALEDFGEAQLVNGVSNVALEPRFADAIDRTAGYLVTVTPEGDCRGLYVALRGRVGFVVRELQGGRSSIAFSYRIVAKPYGDTSARLPLASMPQISAPIGGRQPKRPMPTRL